MDEDSLPAPSVVFFPGLPTLRVALRDSAHLFAVVRIAGEEAGRVARVLTPLRGDTARRRPIRR